MKNIKMIEVWKTIDNFTDLYEVSNLGNVRSKKSGQWKMRKQLISNKGYYRFKIANKSYSTHRAVCIAFLDNPHKYPIINHKDGNKLNNNVENLEWCDLSHNLKEAWRLGRKANPPIGENVKTSKLKAKDIPVIRDLYKDGVSQSQIARDFNVCVATIHFIIKRKRWKHIQ